MNSVVIDKKYVESKAQIIKEWRNATLDCEQSLFSSRTLEKKRASVTVYIALARLLVLRPSTRIFEEKRDCFQSNAIQNNASVILISGISLISFRWQSLWTSIGRRGMMREFRRAVKSY